MALAVTNIATRTAAVGNSDPCTYPGAVTPGSLLVACGWFYNSGGSTAPAVSDSVNGAWTVSANSFDSLTSDPAIQVFIAFKENTAAGTPTVTVNPSGASADVITWAICEVTGAAAVTPNDVNPTTIDSTGTGTDYDSPASGTLAQANEILFAVLAHSAGTQTITVEAGWTQLHEDENNSPNQAGSAAYKIVTATTSETHTWVISASDGVYNAVLQSFKEGAGGGGGTLNVSSIGEPVIGGSTF